MRAETETIQYTLKIFIIDNAMNTDRNLCHKIFRRHIAFVKNPALKGTDGRVGKGIYLKVRDLVCSCLLSQAGLEKGGQQLMKMIGKRILPLNAECFPVKAAVFIEIYAERFY